MEKYFNKLDEIEEKEEFNEYDFEVLKYFSRNANSDVRCRVAEILFSKVNKEGEEILINLIDDKNELVRTNACDSLCSSNSQKILQLLKSKVLEDKSYLVRGYALVSISEIAARINHDIREFLICALEKEEVKWVKINFYKALYMVGETTYLKLLIEELNNEYHGIRCAVVNILSEIISRENLEVIMKALKKRLKVEEVMSVKTEIEDFIALEPVVLEHKRTSMKTL
ncbi:hypothetical protein NL50_05430 [Clostridium acetobutylicum]|nr:hypothetical protein NL50_05430 [Clostridium acetobutylicum]